MQSQIIPGVGAESVDFWVLLYIIIAIRDNLIFSVIGKRYLAKKAEKY
jgi:hypothetical protein